MPSEMADPRPQPSDAQATERNRLLRALPPSLYARVMDELELLELPIKPLGVRRASVTVAAGILQRAGFIRYSRGRVEVLDRRALEAASCECYRIVADATSRSLPVPVA
jgi:hypothetical protein